MLDMLDRAEAFVSGLLHSQLLLRLRWTTGQQLNRFNGKRPGVKVNTGRLEPQSPRQQWWVFRGNYPLANMAAVAINLHAAIQ